MTAGGVAAQAGTVARACSAWAGVCPARMSCGIRSATSIQAAPRTGCTQSISQIFWSWLISRLLVLMSPCSSRLAAPPSVPRLRGYQARAALTWTAHRTNWP